MNFLNKDDNFHKSEALELDDMKNEHIHLSGLNKQNIHIEVSTKLFINLIKIAQIQNTVEEHSYIFRT